MAPKRESEVLDVAAHVFHVRGYADATIRDLARELGLNNGSLYHYMQTKEDLLVRLLEQSRDGAWRVLDEVAATPGLTPLERLGLYVQRQVGFMLEHLPVTTIYCRDIERLSAARRREIAARHRDHERWVLGVIADAQAAGEIPAETHRVALSRCVFALIISAHRWYRPDRDDAGEVAAMCAALAVRGLAGQTASRSATS